MIRIGGRTYQSFIFDKFEIVCKSIDEKESVERMPIRILKPISMKVNELENLDRFPNLLGIDFLEKGYELLCNIQENKIHLEKLTSS
ncbi:MAG TPA: hypothetical protein VJK51_01390 [Candidatus Nanoarchaeia archaeon]|nr:hypothetical protein [Candidatus Nanoarchaeia archaeon]